MVSTMSMKAGHSCTHAMHVVQAHSSSGLISSPWMGPGSSPCRWRLSFTMTRLGTAPCPPGRPGTRPGSARTPGTRRSRAAASTRTPPASRCRGVSAASSMFVDGRMAPRGPSLEKKMLSGVVMRWTKYEYGMMAMKNSEITAWNSHTPRCVAAQRALRHARRRACACPSAQPTGDHGAHHGCTTASRQASMTNPVRLMTNSRRARRRSAPWDRSRPAAARSADRPPCRGRSRRTGRTGRGPVS